MALTDKQLQVLEAICSFTRKNGYPPTVREIGEAVGLSSPASVLGHLRALQREGLIRRGPLKRRALEVLAHADLLAEGGQRSGPAAGARSVGAVHPVGGTRRLPLVGRVAAGRPTLADEQVEDMLEIPAFLAQTGECFILRVKGSSMVKAGILDGDLVVVRRQETAQNGDIVVAVIDDEATVKRFFREKDHVRLQPENDDLEPIYVRDPVIAGKVVGLIRRVS